MSEVERLPLGWSDQELPLHSVVSFYYSDEDTARQSVAFLQVGLAEPGTVCVVLADASRHRAVLDQLRAAHEGDLQELIEAGKLLAVAGLPSVEDLAGAMVPRLDQALAAGYERVRLLGFMAWGQPGRPDASVLKHREAQLNELAARYPIAIVCAYNVPQLPGDYVREKGLGNEPLIVINDPVVP